MTTSERIKRKVHKRKNSKSHSSRYRIDVRDVYRIARYSTCHVTAGDEHASQTLEFVCRKLKKEKEQLTERKIKSGLDNLYSIDDNTVDEIVSQMVEKLYRGESRYRNTLCPPTLPR